MCWVKKTSPICYLKILTVRSLENIAIRIFVIVIFDHNVYKLQITFYLFIFNQ